MSIQQLNGTDYAIFLYKIRKSSVEDAGEKTHGLEILLLLMNTAYILAE